jgi:hypothetical protein
MEADEGIEDEERGVVEEDGFAEPLLVARVIEPDRVGRDDLKVEALQGQAVLRGESRKPCSQV